MSWVEIFIDDLDIQNIVVSGVTVDVLKTHKLLVKMKRKKAQVSLPRESPNCSFLERFFFHKMSNIVNIYQIVIIS